MLKNQKNKDLEKSHTAAIFDKKSNFEVLKKILQGLMLLTKLLMIYFKKLMTAFLMKWLPKSLLQKHQLLLQFLHVLLKPLILWKNLEFV
jgi:hypothetical protein